MSVSYSPIGRRILSYIFARDRRDIHKDDMGEYHGTCRHENLFRACIYRERDIQAYIHTYIHAELSHGERERESAAGRERCGLEACRGRLIPFRKRPKPPIIIINAWHSHANANPPSLLSSYSITERESTMHNNSLSSLIAGFLHSHANPPLLLLTQRIRCNPLSLSAKCYKLF